MQRVRFRTVRWCSLLFEKIAVDHSLSTPKRTGSRPFGFHVYHRCTTVTTSVLGNRQCFNKLNEIILKIQTTRYRTRGR